MSQNTEPPSSTPPRIAFDIRVEIGPKDLELIDKAAAIEGIDRQTYLERAAEIGILDSRRNAEITIGFAELDKMAPEEP